MASSMECANLAERRGNMARDVRQRTTDRELLTNATVEVLNQTSWYVVIIHSFRRVRADMSSISARSDLLDFRTVLKKESECFLFAGIFCARRHPVYGLRPTKRTGRHLTHLRILTSAG